ncbi:MAG: hypothetical protein HOU81_07965 [Hamadaea sp.]|uniref:hypothetical protein n=1 Tax=Hamadaea sp. TaxID=2024425 RepID=UPI00181783BB|nr:hypothetical protein [Hamadaea sp.]NUR70743.1 hypothetical protein [Hamadaea sp.]NUT23943.1 hypothetical protein [Hamadaea sp.]
MSKTGIADRAPAPSAQDTSAIKTGVPTAIAAVGLVWLAVTLAVARGTLHGSTGDVALSTAALSLPALIQAALFAGIAAGFAVTIGIVRRRTRIIAGFGTGLGVGALAFGTVLLGYGLQQGLETAVAASIGVAALLGGGIGTLRPARMLQTGLTATLPVIVLGYLVGHFSEPLLKLFGDNGTVASRYSASGYIGMTEALVQGLVAGIVAFVLLRRSGPIKVKDNRLVFAAYAFAGALPGLIIGLSEIFTRVGAAWLIDMATEFSDYDKILFGWGNGNRTNQALVVFFIGALVSLILYGRTIKKPAA